MPFTTLSKSLSAISACKTVLLSMEFSSTECMVSSETFFIESSCSLPASFTTLLSLLLWCTDTAANAPIITSMNVSTRLSILWCKPPKVSPNFFFKPLPSCELKRHYILSYFSPLQHICRIVRAVSCPSSNVTSLVNAVPGEALISLTESTPPRTCAVT